MPTFAEHLRQFAYSVDIVSDKTLADARDLITRYLTQALAVDYFEVMVETLVNEKPGLETFWTNGAHFSNSLKDGGNEYQGQTAMAFVENSELWIVADDGGSLDAAKTYIDQWNHRKSLPTYRNVKLPGIKTSIIVPLRDRGRPFGVLDLESKTRIEISDQAKRELAMISESVALLSLLRKSSKIQDESTQKAVKELGHVLTAKSIQRMSKPKLFLASSANADRAVLTALRRTLKDYSNQLDVVWWDDISASGNINEHITREILSSSYGVCYLSEPKSASSRNAYVDNPNVLFEAGMLHVLSHTHDSTSEGWIPIREEHSPNLPFDFATERILLVPRDKKGTLDEVALEGALRVRLGALLKAK